MLYVTTRGKAEVYTAARTLQIDRGADEGFFVPFRPPVLTPKDVTALAGNKPSQNIADYLNLLFGTKLTDWDVELILGRNGFQLKELGHKLVIAELWHNRTGRAAGAVRELARHINPDGVVDGNPTEWLCLSIRIALVIGIMTELLRNGTVTPYDPINVAVCSGDFSQVMSVWYAREMGLPIADIIIGCNENSGVWDLINRGEIATYGRARATSTPEADFVVPPYLERLVHGACGQEEALKLNWCTTEKESYIPEEEQFEALRHKLFAAVISQVRLEIVIPSVYRSHQYIMDPYTALSYGALSDYRAKTGDGSWTLLLSENSPMANATDVARIMRISEDELRRRVR